MQITLQTLNKYFNINRNKAQDNQKNYQVQNFGIANPFAPISRDVVEISFGASRCSTQNFQIKNKIENLRCPACGLIMLTEKQISNFATEVGACRGEELIEALEKYEDESTLTGKPSQDKTGFGVYRPLKKEVVDVYKELARENPELNLLELTQLEATNCIQELIDKQMDVIWELEDYIKTNFDEETQKEFLDKIEGFVSQIQGETEETFARKKFIYAIDSLVQDADAKAKLKEITSKMPTSENDIDSFFVKYSHKTKPQEVAKALVKQTIPTAEHLIPKSKNGGNRLSNYICDCADCNSRRGNMDFYDWLKELPGFEERLQLYIEDVQEAIDAKKLSPEYDTYIELIVETIAALSEGELILEIPEIKNPEKKEVVMAKRGREVEKVKSKNEALIQKRDELAQEIMSLEKYPNFDEVNEHREIIERIAQVNEQIEEANAKLIELRKPINIAKEEIAALEAKKREATSPADRAELKRQISEKTQEYEELLDVYNKQESTLGKLRRKQVKLKKQRRYYNLKELAIAKKIEELKTLIQKINAINLKISKLGNPASKEEECQEKIRMIDEEITQKQQENAKIQQNEGFNSNDKSDFELYEHNLNLLTISQSLLSGRGYKKTGYSPASVREIVEIAQKELEKSVEELGKKDTVIFFLNTNDIYRLQIKKEEHQEKLAEYRATKEQISLLRQEIQSLVNNRTLDEIQKEFSTLSGEKRIIDEIHKISKKREKLDELTKIIRRNNSHIKELENYRTLSNNEWSELMSFIEVEDVL